MARYNKHRITNRVDISLEEREQAIVRYINLHPRKGVPNPFMAELWKNDEFYLKVIEARPKTLSPDQVRAIRKLSSLGRSDAEIVDEIGALNETQVKNVLKGKTYRRIV